MPVETPATETQVPAAGGAAAVVETLNKMADVQTSTNKRLDDMEAKLTKAEQVQYPYGMPNGTSFGIRKGENPLTSRPFSMMRLSKALRMRLDGQNGWNEHAKVEFDLSDRLTKNYYGGAAWDGFGSGTIVPLAAELMPTEERKTEDGEVIKGMSRELVAECRQIMKCDGGVDFDELSYALRASGMAHLSKDMSSFTATSGGTLVGLAAQGELIELLRAIEMFSQAGATTLDLPPQGKIRFPRITGSVTIAATSEGATISESTPTTGALELSAKPYTGLCDIPDELMRFSTSVALEGWLRAEFVREIALKADRDMINGAGGTAIRGVVNYGSIRTVLASTVATDGNTLGPDDPARLYADIADQNAPIDRGFFFALTNTMWAGLKTRKSGSSAEYMFQTATQSMGGPQATKSLEGEKVITSTQVPTNRAKGAGTALTLLLGGVGPEWLIARAGVIEVAMTNSDASKFQNRISTLRGTQYIDAGPRHEASFGIVDTLLNS